MVGKEEIKGKDSRKNTIYFGDMEGSCLAWTADVFWRRLGTLTREEMWRPWQLDEEVDFNGLGSKGSWETLGGMAVGYEDTRVCDMMNAVFKAYGFGAFKV